MTASLRAFLAAVGALALWVAVWGLVLPADVTRALPWTVPPLHARFIGALHAAGALAMGLALGARQPATVRIPVALAIAWTGSLFLLSLPHLDAFDTARPQTWSWFGACLLLPLWGGWLWRRRGLGRLGEARARPEVPLLAVAAATGAAGLALAVAPALAVPAWPWRLPPMLAQLYAGPFLAWALAAWLLAREGRRESRRIALVAMLALAVLAIGASWLHRALIDPARIATWLWFGGFAAWAVIALRSLVARPPRR